SHQSWRALIHSAQVSVEFASFPSSFRSFFGSMSYHYPPFVCSIDSFSHAIRAARETADSPTSLSYPPIDAPTRDGAFERTTRVD
ncbi:hypothetical protein PFISCL1PPCAC_253, partial [Pristionchus fissidentatus]